VGLLAVVSSGARVAPLNPKLTLSELSTRLSELSAHAVLAPEHGKQAGVCGRQRWKRCSLEHEYESSGGAYKVRMDGNQKGPASDVGCRKRMFQWQDIAVVMFTAGTTSSPKLVPLTLRNILGVSPEYCLRYDLSPGRRNAHRHAAVPWPRAHCRAFVNPGSGGSAYLPSGALQLRYCWNECPLRMTWNSV